MDTGSRENSVLTASSNARETLTPMERYQVKPFVGSSHHWAMSKLEEVLPSQTVLDVGPGSGVMGEFLRNRNVQQTFAVEIDAAARSHVARHYEQVEESIAALAGKSFNWVLLLDVLEHMADPFRFLQDVDALMAPGCRLLISLPNIAHWSVRFPLLFGFFEYAHRGILDETHLQFFNRRRFLRLIRSVDGWRVLETNASIEPVEFVLPKWIWDNSLFPKVNHVRSEAARLLPGLMAFQHLALVQKSL